MNDERKQMKQWVDNWKKLGPELDRIKRGELQNIDLPAVMERFEDAFEAALRRCLPRLSSGLVEQQRLFAELRQ